MGHWAQNQASAMTIPVLWPEPVENEWGELKRRSCESEGSGETIFNAFFYIGYFKKGGAAWYVPPCLPVSVKMTSTHRKNAACFKAFQGTFNISWTSETQERVGTTSFCILI